MLLLKSDRGRPVRQFVPGGEIHVECLNPAHAEHAELPAGGAGLAHDDQSGCISAQFFPSIEFPQFSLSRERKRERKGGRLSSDSEGTTRVLYVHSCLD